MKKPIQLRLGGSCERILAGVAAGLLRTGSTPQPLERRRSEQVTGTSVLVGAEGSV